MQCPSFLHSFYSYLENGYIVSLGHTRCVSCFPEVTTINNAMVGWRVHIHWLPLEMPWLQSKYVVLNASCATESPTMIFHGMIEYVVGSFTFLLVGNANHRPALVLALSDFLLGGTWGGVHWEFVGGARAPPGPPVATPLILRIKSS